MTAASKAVIDLLNQSAFSETVGRLMECAYLRGQADLLRDQRDALQAERERFEEDREQPRPPEFSDDTKAERREIARQMSAYNRLGREWPL